jgi:hypothetical protein
MSDNFIDLSESVPRYPHAPLTFTPRVPGGVEMIGFIPSFLDLNDPRSAKEQFNERYAHGGGWDPFQTGNIADEPGRKFIVKANSLDYPGDPPMRIIAEAKLRDEVIRVYDCAWVAIIQPNGDYEICRMD